MSITRPEGCFSVGWPRATLVRSLVPWNLRLRNNSSKYSGSSQGKETTMALLSDNIAFIDRREYPCT